MDPFESHTQSFVIRIWRERAGPGGSRSFWRGHITRVPGGERGAVQQFGDIAAFMLPYLVAMGVRPPWSWTFWLQVRAWKRRLKIWR
jgi:hypothetical protein